jgi:hypothetical protein
MVDAVGALVSVDISWMRSIAPSCRSEKKSLADLGGFAMLDGRCGGDDLCCEGVVASELPSTSDAVDGLGLSPAEVEYLRSGAEEEAECDINRDGGARVAADDCSCGSGCSPCGLNPSETAIAA